MTIEYLFNSNSPDILTLSLSSYFLIFAAEIGDKSQLVCMALAARYRATPVILAAISAFILLNTLAVVFGVAIASSIPDIFVVSIVAILFFAFGIHALFTKESFDNEKLSISGKNLFITTFLLIIFAEFGDKTQLAIIALSSTNLPIAIWIGSTMALITTSVLGVWAGRTILQKIPITLIHRISGIVFIIFAILSTHKAYLLYQ